MYNRHSIVIFSVFEIYRYPTLPLAPLYLLSIHTFAEISNRKKAK